MNGIFLILAVFISLQNQNEIVNFFRNSSRDDEQRGCASLSLKTNISNLRLTTLPLLPIFTSLLPITANPSIAHPNYFSPVKKNTRTQLNTSDTLWVNSYTKITRKTYSDACRSRQEFFVLLENQVFHDMKKAVPCVSKSGKWLIIKICIAIDVIWDCYTISNNGWSC